MAITKHMTMAKSISFIFVALFSRRLRDLSSDRAALVAKLGQLRDFVNALPSARFSDYQQDEPKRGGVPPPPRRRNFAAPGPPRPPVGPPPCDEAR